MSSRAYVITIFYFMLFGVIIATITLAIGYKIRTADTAERLGIDAQSVYEDKRERIELFLLNVERTLLALEESASLNDFLLDASAQNRSNLRTLMQVVTAANGDFFQTRFIDATGMEVVRIDRQRGSDEVFAVTEAKLQDKSGRYYFQASKKLLPKRFWHSKLDLNVERGTLEQPLRPTLRVALPVYRDALLRGILIVNVEMEDFLSELRKNPMFNIYLVDGEGYYIFHRDDAVSWSRYVGPKWSLRDEFAADATEILHSDRFVKEGLFSYLLESAFDNGEKIRLILVPKIDYIQRQRENNTEIALYAALLVLLLGVPMGAVLAIGPARLQAKLDALLQKNLKYTDIIDNYVVTSSTDTSGRLVKVSRAFCEVSGYSRQELIGKKHSIIKSGLMKDDVYKNLWERVSSGRVWMGELQNRRKDGSFYWTDTTILPEYDEQGGIKGYTAISHDISDKKIIEELSVHDSLTGLGNRTLIDRVLEDEIERAERYGQVFSVIMLDIDHFKTINDTYGHLIGDEVLIGMASILTRGIRKTDTAGRWGGEEFLIVCPETSPERAEVLAENLRQLIAAQRFGETGFQSASFGISGYRPDDTADTLLQRVDEALYRAKQQGRNRVLSV